MTAKLQWDVVRNKATLYFETPSELIKNFEIFGESTESYRFQTATPVVNAASLELYPNGYIALESNWKEITLKLIKEAIPLLDIEVVS